MKNLIFIMSLLLSFNKLQAFTLNNNISAGFGHDTVKIYVTSNSTCSNAGVSKEELLDMAVQAANQYWNPVPSSRLIIERGGFYQTSNANFLTGELCVETASNPSCPGTAVPKVTDIVIACNNETTENFPGSGSGTQKSLAISVPNNVQGRNIVGSVILINDTGSSLFGTLSRSDMVAVLAHEIGHAVGLGHSPYPKNLMYFATINRRDRLGQDDIDGLTYLYPMRYDGCGLFGTISTRDSSNPSNKGQMNHLLGMLIIMLSLPLMAFWYRRKSFELTKT